MSNAEELLNSLTEEDISTTPTVEEHIIVGADRFITVPEPLQRIAVQYDHNVETVTFDCPRYWDEHDLSTLDIYVNYNREDGIKSRSNVKNIVVDETDENIIHFDWTITEEITSVPGKLFFLVCAVRLNEEGEEELHWNSELNNQMYVSTGLEGLESVYERYPDIITDLLTRMDYILVGDGTVLDKSLTLENFGAEAKTVGDRFKVVDETLESLQEQITDNDADIENLQEQITSNDQDIISLQEQITDNDADIENLQEQITSNDADISNINNEINIIKSKIETGNFTPYLKGDNSTISVTPYTTQYGSYYKNDKIIYFDLRVDISTKVIAAANDASTIVSTDTVQVAGLPFAASAIYDINLTHISLLNHHLSNGYAEDTNCVVKGKDYFEIEGFTFNDISLVYANPSSGPSGGYKDLTVAIKGYYMID